MNDTVKTLAPALIALIGTIITAVLGYIQWKRQHKTERYLKINNDKRTAYKKLWGIVENAHIKIRDTKITQEDLSNLIKEIVFFSIENSLSIDESDGQLAIQYVESLFRLDNLVTKSNNKEIEQQWRQTNISLNLPTKMELIGIRLANILRTISFLTKYSLTKYSAKKAEFIRLNTPEIVGKAFDILNREATLNKQTELIAEWKNMSNIRKNLISKFRYVLSN